MQIKLGEKDVTLLNMRTMGVTSIALYCDQAYFYNTEKQVEKLFGK